MKTTFLVSGLQTKVKSMETNQCEGRTGKAGAGDMLFSLKPTCVCVYVSSLPLNDQSVKL